MTETVVPSRSVTPPPDCWRRIGVSGDRSCPELEEFVHCRNCPVLADAARAFFDRPAPEGYLESWQRVLERPDAETDLQATGVLVFRIGAEWLALPTAALAEISPPRRAHRLPHRDRDLLEGLVNIRGELRPCVSLGALLGLERRPGPADASGDRRLLVLERLGECWVFPVDAVVGVQRVPRSSLRAVPSTVSAAARAATVALFEAHGRTVGLLDEARLLNGLCERIRT